MSLYFIITLPPEEKSSPVVFSHQNPPAYLFRTVLDCFCLWSICAYFSPDSDEMISLEEAILWIEDLYFSQKQQFEACWWISYKHGGFLLHKTLIDGLESCGLFVNYCNAFINCLNSLSDGTHSLQRIGWWANFQQFSINQSKTLIH